MERTKVLKYTVIPQLALLGISIFWIYVSPKDNILKYLSFSDKTILFGVLTGILLAISSLWVFKRRSNELGNDLKRVYKNLRGIDLIIVASLTGFCQQIFFTGLLLPRFGIVVASIAFGLLHMPGKKYWIYTVWATLSGALFGWLFLLTNSLWTPITANATCNLIGIIMLKKLNKSSNILINKGEEMGIGKFIKGIFDPKALGENIVEKQVEVYQQQKNCFPNEEPHVHLAQTWLSRMAVHGKDSNDASLQTLAFTETYIFACLPPPICAKALGLYILYKERLDIIEACPKFKQEFNQLMMPVMQAQNNGTDKELYKKYNPKMSKQM